MIELMLDEIQAKSEPPSARMVEPETNQLIE